MRLAVLYVTTIHGRVERTRNISVEEPPLMLFLVGLDLDVRMMCEVGMRARTADDSGQPIIAAIPSGRTILGVTLLILFIIGWSVQPSAALRTTTSTNETATLSATTQ